MPRDDDVRLAQERSAGVVGGCDVPGAFRPAPADAPELRSTGPYFTCGFARSWWLKR